MKLEDCNPFLRTAEIQPSVLEGDNNRIAYDCRLFFVLSGNGFIYINGEEFCLSPDYCVYIPVGVPYTFSGKMKVIVLNFDFTRDFSDKKVPLCPAPEKYFDYEKVYDRTLSEGFLSPFVFSSDAFIKESFYEAVNTFNAKGKYFNALCSSYLKSLLAKILLNCVKKPTPETTLAENVRCFIRLNATEIKDNEDIAKEFGYHPVYIESVFKKKTGKTIHESILNERLKIACKYLGGTNMTIERIAFDTGFSSRSHFCTVFKKTFGITPNAYRKNYEY